MPALRLITNNLPSSKAPDIPFVPEAMSVLNTILHDLQLYSLSAGGVFIVNDLSTGKIVYEFVIPKLTSQNTIISEGFPFHVANNERICGMQIDEIKKKIIINYTVGAQDTEMSFSFRLPTIKGYVDYAIYELEHFWKD